MSEHCSPQEMLKIGKQCIAAVKPTLSRAHCQMLLAHWNVCSSTMLSALEFNELWAGGRGSATGAANVVCDVFRRDSHRCEVSLFASYSES